MVLLATKARADSLSSQQPAWVEPWLHFICLNRLVSLCQLFHPKNVAQDQAMMLAHCAGKPPDCASAELLSWPDSSANLAFLARWGDVGSPVSWSPPNFNDCQTEARPLDSLYHRTETWNVRGLAVRLEARQTRRAHQDASGRR